MSNTTTITRPDTVRGAHGSGLVLLAGDDERTNDYHPRHARPLQAPTQYDDRLVALAALAASN